MNKIVPNKRQVPRAHIVKVCMYKLSFVQKTRYIILCSHIHRLINEKLLFPGSRRIGILVDLIIYVIS